ncbi:DGQHR domain-containing protein [Aliarcobacter butzleri]|uniref:DGQHR domain-containing protein n=1 Tax=Aliarcobacter butzleri TaxID=28197 RepID=UPI0034506A59
MLTINGFWLNQRGNDEAPKIFIFTMKAKELLQYCKTEAVSRGTTGIQRILIESRVNNVKKFFTKNPKNIIPTSIFVSINKEPKKEEGVTITYSEQELKFECQNNEKFITIIDGQHRLQGMGGIDNDINVLVSAMVSPDEVEEAFQFIIINNKSHKVPPDHVKSIISNFDSIEVDLTSRLKEVGVSVNKQIPNIDLIDTEDESPLKGLINWTNNPKGIIALTAIEQVLNYIDERIQEAKEDPSIKRDILYQIWKAISEKYTDIWEERENNHLFEKSPFLVLTSILVDNAFSYCDIMNEMENEISLTDSDTFYDATVMYLKKFPSEFWTKTWTKKGLDTAAGRVLIKNSIQQIKTNIRNKEENLFLDVDIT